MVPVTPATAEDLAQTLQQASATSRSIAVIGNNTKRAMAGPAPSADMVLSTSRLNRVTQYEPNDLTISVEAGMRFSVLQELLLQNRQMIALDPPFDQRATLGGVIASNSSGSMRRLYGTARDLVIGMKFAMLDGKIISSGGMVVKNVAGLDMGKLLIGSFGTLAVITSINFRLHAVPEYTSTFLFPTYDLESSIDLRNWLLRGPLCPMAVDLLSPPAAARIGWRGYVLAVRAGGSRKALERYGRDLSQGERLDNADDRNFWAQVREFPADFLLRQAGGIVIRITTTLSEVGSVFRLLPETIISRAGSGVTYVYLITWNAAARVLKLAAERGWTAVVEYAPDEVRRSKNLWTGGACQDDNETFAMMRKIKEMFDPNNLLNRARLYGRI